LDQVVVTDSLGHGVVLMGAGTATLTGVEVRGTTISGLYASGVDELILSDVEIALSGQAALSLDDVDLATLDVRVTDPGRDAVVVTGACTQIDAVVHLQDVWFGSGWTQTLGAAETCGVELLGGSMVGIGGDGMYLDVESTASLIVSMDGVRLEDVAGDGVVLNAREASTVVARVAESSFGVLGAPVVGYGVRSHTDTDATTHLSVDRCDLQSVTQSDSVWITTDTGGPGTGAWVHLLGSALGNGVAMETLGAAPTQLAGPPQSIGVALVDSDGGAVEALGNTSAQGPPAVRVTGAVVLIDASQVLTP